MAVNEQEYAELILDFLDSMYSVEPEFNILLSVKNGNEIGDYLFFEGISMSGDRPHLTKEKIIERIQYMIQTSPF